MRGRIIGFAVVMLTAVNAWASVPNTVAVEGRLVGNGGGPVADGAYDVEFALYAAQDAAAPAWKEAVKAVGVKGGVFAYVLGSAQALTADALVGTASGGVWLGVKVGADPEMPRKVVNSAPYAMRAGVAESLACSGCVTAGMLDGKVLAGYAKTADVAKIGTSCGSGMVVKGLKADGSLECVAGNVVGGKCAVGQVVTEVKADGSVVCAVAPAGQLAPDSLSQVSNGLLTNVFDEVYVSTTVPKAIPDNNPGGILDEIVVPETGIVQTIGIDVEIESSDISQLTVVVFDPENNAYKLHDKSGAGTSLKTGFPVPTKTVSGDLNAWISKNPKGTWRLVVTDWKVSGKATDGQLAGWVVKVKVLSTTKVVGTQKLIAPGNPVKCISYNCFGNFPPADFACGKKTKVSAPLCPAGYGFVAFSQNPLSQEFADAYSDCNYLNNVDTCGGTSLGTGCKIRGSCNKDAQGYPSGYALGQVGSVTVSANSSVVSMDIIGTSKSTACSLFGPTALCCGTGP